LKAGQRPEITGREGGAPRFEPQGPSWSALPDQANAAFVHGFEQFRPAPVHLSDLGLGQAELDDAILLPDATLRTEILPRRLGDQ